MAIIKDFKTPQGITAQYHRIVKAEISPIENSMQITLAVYAGAMQRKEGSSPLWHENVCIPFSAFSVDPRAALYKVLESYNSSYLRHGVADQEPKEGIAGLTEAALVDLKT
jgi:hypothetical protein